MTKPKRKLKVEFPIQRVKPREDSKRTLDIEDKTELEQIILEEPPKIQIPKEDITPSLKLSESTLETQIQNTPIAENKEEPQNQLYESIKYTSTIESNYQGSSYSSSAFTSPPPSSDFSPQQDFSRNPLMGFRQANPFDPQGYPKTPEKNYESPNNDNNQKKRRM